MKTVFTNSSEVIHLFVQQVQESARCSNVFFRGNKIYSYGYHYLLGEFVLNKKGDKAIIINDTGYSVTTSKHISELKYGSRQFKQFFTSEIEVKNVLNTVNENLRKLVNALKKEKYIIPTLNLFDELNAYIAWAGKKEIKKSDEYKAIVKAIKPLQNNTISEYIEKEQKRLEKIAVTKAKNEQKEIIKFENFEVNRIYGTVDYLRISKGGDFVETTQGVRIEVNEAKQLYLAIKNKVNIVGYKIGMYTVKSMDKTLNIGCHSINLKSVEKVGKLICGAKN